jgi:hypothetical protein
MSLSGWFAIICWALIALVVFGTAGILAWRDRHLPSEPGRPTERLDFRDWLDDWDEVWR